MTALLQPLTTQLVYLDLFIQELTLGLGPALVTPLLRTLFFEKLKEILPNSGILKAVEASEHTAADVRIVRKLPPLLTALQDRTLMKTA